MEIVNHLLKNTPYNPSPNRSGKFSSGSPDMLVIHYTAGPSMESARNSFLQPSAKASAHIIIERDGNLLQIVPFDTIAWHAGQSAYGQRKNLNRYSIGIELVNAGRLEKTDKGFEAWFGKLYPKKEVIEAIHRNEKTPAYWHRYTKAQLKVCEELCQLLMKEYGIKTIVGHEEISPRRKQDPGPAFPLDELRGKVSTFASTSANASVDKKATAGKEVGVIKQKVSASSLNIRKGPGTQHETLAAPLPKDHEVEVLESKGSWVKVRTTAVVEGWVYKKYLK